MIGATPLAHADLRIALTPAAPLITTGQEFDLFVDVTGGSDAFNGFDLVVTYDPNALTLLPATPSKSQEGCLMTGTCSGACGTTYHQFQSAGDSASVTDVLLCNKVALSGPGRLYRLHFRAKPGRTPRSPVSIRRARFYNGGLAVTNVTTTDAMVLDPALLGVGGASLPGARACGAEPPAPLAGATQPQTTTLQRAAIPPRNSGPAARAHSRYRRGRHGTTRIIRRTPEVMREDAARVKRGDLFGTWSNEYLK